MDMLLKDSFGMGIGTKIVEFFNKNESSSLSFITHWLLLRHWNMWDSNEIRKGR